MSIGRLRPKLQRAACILVGTIVYMNIAIVIVLASTAERDVQEQRLALGCDDPNGDISGYRYFKTRNAYPVNERNRITQYASPRVDLLTCAKTCSEDPNCRSFTFGTKPENYNHVYKSDTNSACAAHFGYGPITKYQDCVAAAQSLGKYIDPKANAGTHTLRNTTLPYGCIEQLQLSRTDTFRIAFNIKAEPSAARESAFEFLCRTETTHVCSLYSNKLSLSVTDLKNLMRKRYKIPAPAYRIDYFERYNCYDNCASTAYDRVAQTSQANTRVADESKAFLVTIIRTGSLMDKHSACAERCVDAAVCTLFTFRTATNQCRLYTGNPSTTSTTGVKLFVLKTCVGTCPSTMTERFKKFSNIIPRWVSSNSFEKVGVSLEDCARTCVLVGRGRCVTFTFAHSLRTCKIYHQLRNPHGSFVKASPKYDMYYMREIAGCTMTPTANSWKMFESSSTGLPDFSYAGYMRGEAEPPIVNWPQYLVDNYGADPTDALSDHLAIQNAIDAAESAIDAGTEDGGLIIFSAGLYLINTDADVAANRQPLRIRRSNIVLRGAGSRSGGTVIEQVRDTASPGLKSWESPAIFSVGDKVTDYSEQFLTNNDVDAESFEVTSLRRCENDLGLEVGDRVSLMLSTPNPTTVSGAYAPHSDDAWKVLTSKEIIEFDEKHTIANITNFTGAGTDQVITFEEPIHTDLMASYDRWKVLRFHHIKGFGVEDISFKGRTPAPFDHNENATYGSGWTTFRLQNVRDSWIRRVSFISNTVAVRVTNSMAVSIYQVALDGNIGHYSFISLKSTGVFIGLIDVRNEMWHGPSVTMSAAGTVIWRSKWMPSSPLDAHGRGPYKTLVDSCKGGVLKGSGGNHQPHHNKDMVIWNYDHRGNVSSLHSSGSRGVSSEYQIMTIPGERFLHYDFWSQYPVNTRFVMPTIVGFTGDIATFNTENMKLLESNGGVVEPQSLYEAQLQRRLGYLPPFYSALQTEWSTLNALTLPN